MTLPLKNLTPRSLRAAIGTHRTRPKFVDEQHGEPVTTEQGAEPLALGRLLEAAVAVLLPISKTDDDVRRRTLEPLLEGVVSRPSIKSC